MVNLCIRDGLPFTRARFDLVFATKNSSCPQVHSPHFKNALCERPEIIFRAVKPKDANPLPVPETVQVYWIWP